jgi:hypothetical protein
MDLAGVVHDLIKLALTVLLLLAPTKLPLHLQSFLLGEEGPSPTSSLVLCLYLPMLALTSS